MLRIFTDGACSGNPGPGGWGVVIVCPLETLTLSGCNPLTTNNRMELTAVIEALSYCLMHRKEDRILQITSDSQYVIKGITQWIQDWLRRDWKTSQKKPVENQDLWKALLQLSKEFDDISWHWVKGHAGHLENTWADRLATEAIKSIC